MIPLDRGADCITRREKNPLVLLSGHSEWSSVIAAEKRRAHEKEDEQDVGTMVHHRQLDVSIWIDLCRNLQFAWFL